MCIVKKSPRSSLRLFSPPLISVRGVSLKPSFERKQHLMSPPIFFAPFFYQTFFPPLFTKIFFLPHNTSSTRFFTPSQPHIFFLFPFPLSKKLPALSPLLTLQTKIFLSHKRTIILACSNYGRSTSISFLEAGDPSS